MTIFDVMRLLVGWVLCFAFGWSARNWCIVLREDHLTDWRLWASELVLLPRRATDADYRRALERMMKDELERKGPSNERTDANPIAEE